MKISQKIIMPNMVILFFLIAIMGYALYVLRSESVALDQSFIHLKKVESLIGRLETSQHAIEFNVLSYKAIQDRIYLERIKKAASNIAIIIADLNKNLTTNHGRNLLTEFLKRRSGINDLRNELIENIQFGDNEKIRLSYLRWSIKVRQVNALVDDIAAFGVTSIDGTLQDIKGNHNIFFVLLSGLFAFLTLIIFISFYFTRRLISVPIFALEELVKKISEGDFLTKLPSVLIDPKDEFSSLAESFQSMAINLDETTVSRNRAQSLAHELDFQKNALDEHAIVSITDADGNITYANDKLCDISGYSQQELLGQSHRLIKSDEHSATFFKDMWRRLTSGQVWRGDIKNSKKEGGFYWVDATIVPFPDTSGKPFQYIAIHTDITALLEARTQAEAATHAKSSFLASMSHEIRTPMAGILGMTNLVLDTDLSPQQLEWTTSIKTSGDNLLKILNEILDQSKLEAGKLEISPVDFHVPSFIKDTVQLFTPKIDEKGLQLTVELSDTLEENLHADSMRIGQIFSNLLSNSIKFTDAGTIAVHVDGKSILEDKYALQISVTDSGIGLHKQAQGSIFSPFTQADSSTSRRFGGTGLGLSISKQLTQLMGGEINVESTEGAGSTFWFSVLCQRAQGKVNEPDRRRSLDRWIASHALKILVAEDNIVNQQLITIILEKLNHEATIAHNGLMAVELMESNNFDLILMDIRMPVMDGLEATAIIRSLDSDKSNIPIIALTADISKENIVEYMEAGINEICGKPLDLPVILQAINSQLGEKIHTTMPQAPAARKKCLDTNEKNDRTKKNDPLNFSSVLERVANMIDQQEENTKTAAIHSSELAGIDDRIVEDLIAQYRQELTRQCSDMKSSLAKLDKNSQDIEAKKSIRDTTHTLKGQSGTFDYHLIAAIAADANNILKEIETVRPEDISNIGVHIDAVSLIVDKQLTGHGGKAGRILLQGIKDYCQ